MPAKRDPRTAAALMRITERCEQCQHPVSGQSEAAVRAALRDHAAFAHLHQA